MAERDFNLEMTGEQVKDALQQLEDRVAEGWAVGEKDGTPVTSGSPYFENNAKYYAEQAGLSATAAASSAATAEQEVEEGIRQGIVGAYVQESATPGAIVTIDDGADDIPLKDLKVNLAINQPGTGDPSPTNVRPIYPVTEAEVYRTGINLIEEVIEGGNIGSTGIIGYNASYCAPIGRVKRGVQYVVTTNATQLVCAFFTDKPENGSTSYDGTRTAQDSKTFIAPIDGWIAFRAAAGYATPQLEVGDTATTYEPYAGQQYLVNIGINQWDEETEQGYIGNDGSLVTEASSIRSANYSPCIAGTQYRVVAPASRAIHWYDKDKTHLSYDPIAAPSTVVTAPSGAAYFKLSAYLQGYPYANNMSVNFPARFNTYHEYTGHTVYGGSADITPGVLTSKYVMVDMGDLPWTYNSTNDYFSTALPLLKVDVAPNMYADRYAYGGRGSTQTMADSPNYTFYYFTNPSQVRIKNTDYTDATAFKSAVAGQTLVYELATPISIQLTPTEVDTLRGDNVIWADCGDITNCEYRADLKMYIDKVVGA